jgi:hypothetical protein
MPAALAAAVQSLPHSKAAWLMLHNFISFKALQVPLHSNAAPS